MVFEGCIRASAHKPHSRRVAKLTTPYSLAACSLHGTPVKPKWAEREFCSGDGESTCSRHAAGRVRGELVGQGRLRSTSLRSSDKTGQPRSASLRTGMLCRHRRPGNGHPVAGQAAGFARLHHDHHRPQLQVDLVFRVCVLHSSSLAGFLPCPLPKTFS